MRIPALTGFIFLLLLAGGPAARAQEALPDDITQRLGLPAGTRPAFVPVATSKDAQYTEEQAERNAPDILSLEGCHAGGNRLLFKTTFARAPRFADSTFILYVDLDNNPETGRRDDAGHRGVDVMVTVANNDVNLSFHDRTITEQNTLAGGALAGSILYLVLDAPLPPAGDQVTVGTHLLSQRDGGTGDGTAHVVARFPRSAAALPALDRKQLVGLRSVSDYRYHDQYVKLEKLEDKGIAAKAVTPAKPMQPGRPRPDVLFAAAGRHPGKAGAVARRQVRVSLLEEAGVDRTAAAVSFGFPLPKGALFDPANLRALSADGKEIPAQFTITSFWPDDSLKWVLVDFVQPLKAKESRECMVEFGSQVKRAPAASPLKVSETAGAITVETGPAKLEIDKQRFNVFRSASCLLEIPVPAAVFPAEGIRLVDEKGKLFTTAGRAPESVRLEENGPRKVVVRVDGHYTAADGEASMRYVARLTFRAGSPRVTLALTTINDCLKNEFTDITSLSMRIQPDHTPSGPVICWRRANGALQFRGGERLRLFQADEKSSTVTYNDAVKETGGRAPGMFKVQSEAGVVTGVVHDFWQRWPKAIGVEGQQLSVDLLPAQPGPEYGAGLPHYLLFPLVSGKYRLKWGMSFTERVTFNFGVPVLEENLAEANQPVVAVVPGAHYAETGALGPLAAPAGKQFAAWDKYMAADAESYGRERDRDRTYGFLNYGDWYGERGRNWGNNEYDFAHGFFMQFARTGNRDYFRLALAAARHQADVDCIHAYPDPFYVGGNLPHSIGHTGTWSETLPLGSWSSRFDLMATAQNGHTWAEGMVDAWCLAGEARVMDAAIGLGEHVAWAMAPNFKALGTHERSAGWSLKAIMGLYRATGDPVYLNAAKQIAAVALREQKFDEGGTWPHVLPRDHAGGHIGARGNNLFLIGILLGGLTAYHQETNDPAVRKALIAGADWVLKSWDDNMEGWPYSATTAGEPLYKATTGLNCLIVQPIAYVGHLTGDERYIRVAEAAMGAVVRGGPEAFGKSIAQKANFTSGTLALLQQWYTAHRPDKGLAVMDGAGSDLATYAAKARDTERHSARAPDEKTFFVTLRAGAGELLAERTPHGAMPKRAEFCTIKVLDAAGAVVKAGKFSTDGPSEFRCPLQGAAGAQFKVVVNDDQRGVWSLSGDNLATVMQTGPEFRIGGVGRGRYHFFVPVGTQEFRVRLLGAHTGTYGGAVLTPANQPAGIHQDANIGPALIPGANVPATQAHPEQGEIVVRPAAADTGKVWSLVLWAAGDIGCELVGVPPYLSLTEAAWFAPK